MPVQKFKSYREAREGLWCFAPDEQYFRQVKKFWHTVSYLQPMRKYPHGITRFKSIDEANRNMDDWILENDN